MNYGNDFEVIIIGGGPAGAAAGIFLSAMGFETCIVEQKQFPREKLCGEFLSREIISQLKEWGYFHEFLMMNPNPVNSIRFADKNGKSSISQLDFTAYGLSRSKLDNFLLMKAGEHNVKVICPAKAVSVKKETNSFRVKVSQQGGNNLEIKAGIIIGAYGKRDLLDNYLGRKFTSRRSGMSGIKFHAGLPDFNYLNENEIYIYADDSAYCGINKVEDDKVTVCYLENTNLNKDDRFDPAGLLRRNLNSEFVPSALLIVSGKDYNRYGYGNIFFGEKEIVKDGIFMVGDAARVIPPLSGDGIGVAFESAKILSNILIKLKKREIDKTAAEKEYRRAWILKLKRRLAVSGMLQNVFFGKYKRKAAMNLVSLCPGITQKLIEITRG